MGFICLNIKTLTLSQATIASKWRWGLVWTAKLDMQVTSAVQSFSLSIAQFPPPPPCWTFPWWTVLDFSPAGAFPQSAHFQYWHPIRGNVPCGVRGREAAGRCVAFESHQLMKWESTQMQDFSLHLTASLQISRCMKRAFWRHVALIVGTEQGINLHMSQHLWNSTLQRQSMGEWKQFSGTTHWTGLLHYCTSQRAFLEHEKRCLTSLTIIHRGPIQKWAEEPLLLA